jgi:proline racemase
MQPIQATDYHTGGEPFRIVTGGVGEIAGADVPARRVTAQGDPGIDVVRRLLCHEPRGHADMYGCFVVPPNDAGADFGVLFWHKDGYSTACGHGTIALGAWAADTGRVATSPNDITDVTIDVPSGRVVARVTRSGGRTTNVTFRNVASYVVARGVPVETSRGPVVVDLGWGGALYASLRAGDVGLAVTLDDYQALIAIGREVKWALNDSEYARHPSDPRLSGVYGTIVYDDLGDTADGPEQRNITIYADGAADRSPCGSGTASRVALLADEGRLGDANSLRHHSIVGSTFVARVAERTTADGHDAVIPEVDGMAYRTGEHTFTLDDADPLGTGFTLR